VNLRSDLSSQGIDPEEIEANYFAACLLMPREFLEADPTAFFVDVEDATAVASLARSYGVSAHAMSLRLAGLTVRR
jgi:Zn-dependent peptidase ImmA (M78 family)